MLLGLDFVMLHVPDLEQARAFYSEKLGFAVEGQQPGLLRAGSLCHGGGHERSGSRNRAR